MENEIVEKIEAKAETANSIPCEECAGTGVGSPTGDACGHCQGTGAKNI